MTRRYGCPTCMNGYCAEHKEAQPTMSEAKDSDTFFGMTMERIRLLDRWERENNYTKMINEAIQFGIKLGREQVLDQIRETSKNLLNGEKQ